MMKVLAMLGHEDEGFNLVGFASESLYLAARTVVLKLQGYMKTEEGIKKSAGYITAYGESRARTELIREVEKAEGTPITVFKSENVFYMSLCLGGVVFNPNYVSDKYLERIMGNILITHQDLTDAQAEEAFAILCRTDDSRLERFREVYKELREKFWEYEKQTKPTQPRKKRRSKKQVWVEP